MSDIEDLTQLAAVVNAKYEQEQRRFAKLIARENEIRSDITRLDDMRRASRSPEANVTEMRAIGADVIWLSWVGQSKAALNIQLAQVLAQKEHFQSAVRYAYGKVLVVEEMRNTAVRGARSKQDQSQLDRAIAQSLMRQ